MSNNLITKSTIARRKHWVAELRINSGQFGTDIARLAKALEAEIDADGPVALLDHLRTCGVIPENYGHDSTEEKVYSKYTDAVIALALSAAGAKSIVLKERADAADVEGVADGFSFVADAKAFRLSRTAKNQKDFKVQAMDTWKRGRSHAIVVCPAYQLPASSSQIYQQAITRNVCILTYSHLAVLVVLAGKTSPQACVPLLHGMLEAVSPLMPDKNAAPYWSAVNRALLNGHALVAELWAEEKLAMLGSLLEAKEEALTVLADERAHVMRMTHDQAIAALMERGRFVSREATIRGLTSNSLLSM